MRRTCAPKIALWLLAGTAAPMSAFSLASCSRATEQATAPSALTVTLVSPITASWTETLGVSGEIAPWQEAIVGAEVSGIRLDEVFVNVGDVVRKGQLLGHYREDLLKADLLQLDAAVGESSANLARARADEKRSLEMQSIGALSKQALEAAQSQVAVAEAQLSAATARRDAQAVRLRHARVLAPDDGVISSRTATAGTVSSLGDELFRLIRHARLEWRAEIPADALHLLKPGMSAVIETLDGTTMQGVLRQIGPSVDSGTRNGIAYVDVARTEGLAPGMYLSGHLIIGERSALTIPESAIVLRDGKRYLMQVDKQHLVHEIEISAGRRRDGAIEIIGNGLSAGQYISSAGAFVADGDLVRVTTRESAAP